MKLSLALASAVAANVVDKLEDPTVEPETTRPIFHPDGKHPCEPNDIRDKFNGGNFPEGFIWSVGTNAYNIEGGWQANGKGNSIWDEYANGRFTQDEVMEFWANDEGRAEGAQPMEDPLCLEQGKTDCWCKTDDCMDGNTAANSWTHLDRDVENLKHLGVTSYRFSLSWSRLMPDGKTPNSDPAAAQYYHTLIDKLIEAGIEPLVTLYAYDLPVELSKDIEMGDDDDFWDQCFGWTCYEIIDYFKEYTRYALTEYSDKVKNWITITEPAVMADWGYGDCSFPPAYPSICSHNGLFASRTARHNALQAHVAAYHIYKDEFNGKDGKMGLILNSRWSQANDETTQADIDAAENEMEMYVGWFADPIFGETGQYSDLLKELLTKNDEWSSMFEFSEAQAALNAGSADFFAINHYNTQLVQACEKSGDVCKYGFEVLPPCEEWEATGSNWNKLAPWGQRRMLWWIDQHYDSKKYPIWITENGLATIEGDEDGDHDGVSDPLNDYFRIDHLNEFMGQTLRAIREDGANVEMYTAWSLMDGFEWNRGYTERFGLFYTNFTELDATTTPKRSADWYAKVVATNCAPGTQEYCFGQELPGDNSTDIPSTDETEAPGTDAPGGDGDGSSAVAIVASTVLSALLSLL